MSQMSVFRPAHAADCEDITSYRYQRSYLLKMTYRHAFQQEQLGDRSETVRLCETMPLNTVGPFGGDAGQSLQDRAGGGVNIDPPWNSGRVGDGNLIGYSLKGSPIQRSSLRARKQIARVVG